jgi:chlorobactene glucosyltransferase
MVTPWIVLGAFMAFGIRFPRPLPPPPAPDGAGRPRVSIVVPARNEEHNIGRCLSSLTAQEYPDFEVLVVDDRSEDRTAAIVRKHPTGNAHRVVLVEGRPLPPGWFGKPWACQQGAEAATGDLLLFTDADTIHAPLLLARSVAALQEDRADALSLVGRQIMETFWERVVQPQVFTLIGMRYTRLDRPVDGGRWTAAVANGQYMLLTRPALEGMGGHAAVKHEVVEDIRMAQELVRGGGRITIRGAEDALGTRMYRNLRELVDGWTKNLFTGARQAAPRGLGAVAVPAILLHLVVLWLLPPLVLLAALAGWLGAGMLLWSGVTTLLSVLLWVAGSLKMRVPPAYGLAYPLGAGAAALIVARSWIRGSRRIEWKGRRYAGEEASPSPPASP